MKITEISIKDFRAFYTPDTPITIKLEHGKNLLVYGENGSGKSSLFLALKLFLESIVDRSLSFDNYRNLNAIEKDEEDKRDGFVRLTISDTPDGAGVEDGTAASFEWSRNNSTAYNKEILRNAQKIKGFIDYKALLETNLLREDADGRINIFPLLMNVLLRDIINNAGDTFFRAWEEVQKEVKRPLPRDQERRVRLISHNKDLVDAFTISLRAQLASLQTEVDKFLKPFDYDLKVSFGFPGLIYDQENPKKIIGGQYVGLNVQFDGHMLTKGHQHFLNEAKLSAIAIAIFLAAIRLQPSSALKVLALDDVLIGLDMSNRMPVLDILDEHFGDFQKILTTYDRVWYEIVKQRTNSDRWKYIEMFSSHNGEHEIPFCTDDLTLLERARHYFALHEYKAAVIFLRTHFEFVLKDYCAERKLAVNYCPVPEKASANDFWSTILGADVKYEPPPACVTDEQGNYKIVRGCCITYKRKPITIKVIGEEIKKKVELYRSLILNPLSHSEITNAVHRDIAKAIEVVAELEARLDSVRSGEPLEKIQAQQEFADMLCLHINNMQKEGQEHKAMV